VTFLKRAQSFALPFLTFVPSVLLVPLFFASPALSAPSEKLLEHKTTATAKLEIAYSGGPAETLYAGQRWYESILRQQQIISEQIDELRSKVNQNLMTTQDFLNGMSSLFERTDRLYVQWKKLGCPVDAKPIPQPATEATSIVRKDMAVGKSLNYLRLSLINFFLGYADSNGSQIADAESQAQLSKAWRTRSLPFIKALDSQG
jgi:hypothetical protein